ncbi:MAG: stage VI sporulation protein F [Bacilli bacterium]|nr:stage VI sporulation protein F [Bacilli bacterium]
MSLNDSLFDKIERKTNVSKELILSLADKLKTSGLKNENTINEVIDELSKAAGKDVSSKTKEKIISRIKNDDVPKNIDKFF